MIDLKKSLIIFNNINFLKTFFKFFIKSILQRDLQKLKILLMYFNVFFFDFVIRFGFFKDFYGLGLNSNYVNKNVLYDNKINNFNDLFYYIYNIFLYYYNYNFKHFLNYKCLNYLITCICYNIIKHGIFLEVNEFYLKLITTSAWALFCSIFIRKKYYEYKNFYRYENFNETFYKYKYKYKYNTFVTNFSLFWKIYYKYGGNYQNYLYIKKFFLLNKKLNKKYIAIYDFKSNKFLLKLNKYYNLLVFDTHYNEYPEHSNEEYYVHSLYDFFLKKNLDTPFFSENSEPVFTFYYFKNKLNKKTLKNLSYLVSYEFLYNKVKKGVLSNLTEEELSLNFNNFYKYTIEKNYYEDVLDVFNVEGNEPYIKPARPYKKFRELLGHEDINFEVIFNDINSFNIEDLRDVIIKAFKYINETDIMFSVNSDLINQLKKDDNENDFSYISEDQFFDYNIIQNDLNLTIWLNKNALNDKSFLEFLQNMKFLSTNVTKNTFNIDLFEEKCLNDADMLNLFLNNNFFYLDYFTLAMNSKKYNLCYLLFVFKILKNINNYESYYNEFCNTTIKKYNKIVCDYHGHVFNKLTNLTNVFNNYIQFKKNSIFISLNNFDSNNFIKQLKNRNFNNLYKINYKNKINYNQKEFNKFYKAFDRYKKESKFEKKEITISEPLTFDDFIYRDIDLDFLNKALLNKQKKLELLMSFYNFKDNTLINFSDIGFYLYDLEDFQSYKDDSFLFFEFRDNPLLDFNIDDSNINKKIEFQNNYSMLYFHYLIKLFKNLKTYTFNTAIENLIFNDNFDYSNFDNTMNDNRKDFLYNLESFLKIFKTIVISKSGIMLKFINSLILNYEIFMNYNKNFKYNILYDSLILDKCDDQKLFHLENELEHILQTFIYFLDKINDLRKTHVDCINLLKLNKLKEFFDFPMFNKVKGFILLKEAYFNCLEELVIEDRAFDHAFNITMCLFRVFNKHNVFFKQQVLFSNGLMPRLSYLELEDWEFVLEIEKENPLILIELYNAKQNIFEAELFNNNVSMLNIVFTLSNIREKQLAYDNLNDDWENFLNKIVDRDILIYDLDFDSIKKLQFLFYTYTKRSYNQFNIDEAVHLLLKNNSYLYNEDEDMYVKVMKDNNEQALTITMPYEQILKKKDKSLNSEIEIKNSDLKYLKKKKDLLIIDKDNNNILYNFNIFSEMFDKNNTNINMEPDFLLFLESKISKFPKSIFTNYLRGLFYTLKLDYKNFYDVNAEIEIDYFTLVNSFNYLFYLTNFYGSILSDFDENSINNINDTIKNNEFNYFNNKFINLSYINLIFKNISKTENEKHWIKTLSKTFNNRFLFINYDAYDYLLKIFNSLHFNDNYKEDTNLLYLPKLNNYIFDCNYKNNPLIYDLYDSNFIITFDNLFNSLNTHILKFNYMLKQFNVFKNLLKDIYLYHCGPNKNNFNILKDLYNILYNSKDKKERLKYIALMNILLYVKDPIYLYNILSIDLKLYTKNLLSIFEIIQESNFNSNSYSRFLKYLMYKHAEFNENLTQPIHYKGWAFSLNNIDKDTIPLITTDELEYTNINFFFSKECINLLNNSLSNLDYYNKNGYFSFDLFSINDTDLNTFEYGHDTLLNLCNINKLLKDFNNLFSVNYINEIQFYSIQEFIIYNEVDNFKYFDWFNYNDLLNFMINQRDLFKFYLKDKDNIDINKKININVKKIKEYADIFDLNKKDLKEKELKRKTVNVTYTIKKKTKIISKEHKKLYFDENIGDFISEYIDIEVTDDEESVDNVTEEDQENPVKLKKSEMINLEQIKLNVVTEMHKNFRQWESDLVFSEAYQECKKIFESVLLDFDHPIWDENRSYFPNYKAFASYIKNLTEEEKNNVFDIYWDWTIQQVKKKRESVRSDFYEKQWDSVLEHANNEVEFFEKKRSNEILHIFCTNLEKNEKLKKEWHKKFFYLDKSLQRSKGSNWRAEQFFEKMYKKEPNPHKVEEGFGFVDSTTDKFKYQPQLELWDSTNWWKKW